jgi:hypothetical protein
MPPQVRQKKKKAVVSAQPSAEEPSVETVPPLSVVDWAKGLVSTLHGQLRADELALLQSQTAALGRETAASAVVTADPTRPIILRDVQALTDAAAQLTDGAELVIDLETSDLDCGKGEIVGIGLASAAAVYYIPLAHRFEATMLLRPNQMPLTRALEILRLQDRKLIAHNAKFEWKWLRQHGKIECQFAWDTMIAARLLHSDMPADLKSTAIRELDVPDWGLAKAEIQRIAFLPVEQAAAYCGKDCYYTLQLHERQRKCLV